MNIYLATILVILIARYLLDLIVDSLNARTASGDLPEEFVGYYDAQKYQQAQNYLRENTRLKLVKDTVLTVVVLAFILSGGFNFVDKLARGFKLGPIFTGLIFAAILMMAWQILNLPFSAYHTFAIEQKYGFNRTTVKTFILDIFKNCCLGAVIGGLVFAGIIWFFLKLTKSAWAYCWVAVTLFQLFLLFITPVTILPLFNKFTPLETGELKQAIEHYLSLVNFKIKGIFKMDASRRSSKVNAFFIGFGQYKRIALFDTMIAKHSVDELVAVLAHEVGHYQNRHILKRLAISTVTTGLAFFILSFFLENRGLFVAFKMENTSIYAGLFFFSFLYTPLNLVFSVLDSFLSRRHEYKADAYSVSTYKRPEAFISALKKMSVENLSNLTPHPLKVFLDYSHPPVLKRIQAIRASL